MSSQAAPEGQLPLVVLISGEGTNLQAILEHCTSGTLPAKVCAVISSRAEAPGLHRAMIKGIPVHAVLAAHNTPREDYDDGLTAIIERYPPGLIVLAGFMRILGDAFVRRYLGRLLNIHPSLLPKYPGLHTHRRAIEDGESEHGCSVHFVTAKMDGGPVIAQVKVPVRPGDTEKSLGARIQRQEHRLYPEVINWFARGRVLLDGEQVVLDGRRLQVPVILPAREHL
jgi:phosphoribosylglycinamide formyltransferase 1